MLQLNRINQRLPDEFMKACLKVLPRGMTGNQVFKYLDWVSGGLEERYRGTSAVLTPTLKRWLYTPDFQSGRGEYLDEVFSSHFARASPRASPLSRMIYVDSKTWLPDNLLLKADKIPMAASVELRVPFLDHRLVEFAASLPDSLRIRQGQGKWILKESMKNHLPEQIIWRRKMGFPVPTHLWFSGDLFPQIQERLQATETFPWINKKVIHQLTDRRLATWEQTRLMMSLLVLNEWRQQNEV